jgi:NADH-quinone oxidoreductase subunit H
VIATEILEAIIFPGVLFTISMGFLFDWLDRKTAARMQGRIGPKITGPSGILQPLADFLKLLFKEEIIPSHADKTIFLFAPALYFLAPLLSMLFIPIIHQTPIAGFEFDLLIILFLLAYAAFVVAVLSYSSASSFTTIATGRLVLQYVSYEIPLVLAIVTAALYSRSLSVEGIVASQTKFWNVFVMPFAFGVYIIALMAELEKPPFDIPSAKTEIVAGWLTEFSGRALAFLKLTKEVGYVFGSALAVSLFLGGPSGPQLGSVIPTWLQFFTYFMIKLLAVGFLIFVLKTALARVKIAQATELFWKVLTPVSLGQLAFILILIQGGILVAP